MCIHPLLGGLVAEMQGGGVPVHSNISISYRSSVLCALYCAAPTEPEQTRVDYLLDKNTNSGNLKTCTLLPCLNLILGFKVDLILWKLSRSVFCLFDIRFIYITVTIVLQWCSITCLTCTRDTRHTSCHPCQRPAK